MSGRRRPSKRKLPALAALDVACPSCDAPPAEPCTTAGGRRRAAHAKRTTEAADRSRELERDRELSGTPTSIVGARWRRVYEAGRAELEVHEDFTPVNAALLERLCRNLEEAETHLATAAKSPIVIGSTGQSVAHPLFALSRGLEASALAAAKSLRLTPDTRVRREAGTGVHADELDGLDALAREDELAKRRRRKSPRG